MLKVVPSFHENGYRIGSKFKYMLDISYLPKLI